MCATKKAPFSFRLFASSHDRFLDLVQSYSLFLTFSFLLRGLEGAGTVGIKASTLIIIRLVFPGRVATLVVIY